LDHGDRFGALLFAQNEHYEMKPSSRRKNCMRLLFKLVEQHQSYLNAYFSKKPLSDSFSKNNDSSLFQTLKRLHYLAKPGAMIHIISDFNEFTPACEKSLAQLAQRMNIHCILVSDPIEYQLPKAGCYGMSDGVNDGILDTHSAQLQEDYSNQFIHKYNKIHSFTMKHRGILTHINTHYQEMNDKPSQKNSLDSINHSPIKKNRLFSSFFPTLKE
jgi:uncharacterized protein (DUF58 family)